MTHMPKARTASLMKWVFSNFVENSIRSSKPSLSLNGSFHVQYGTKRSVLNEKSKDSNGVCSSECDNIARITPSILKQAQDALLDYFYCTRSLQFADAENMSRNAPHFTEKLLRKLNTESDVGHSVIRFLRYHPINEFEPFFESLGLDPLECGQLLPRDLMYLSDDGLLLENYHVLCNYGIARNRIGKIYKEAVDVFRYEFGVLTSKLQAYEEVGFTRSFMLKIIVCSPRLLIGEANMDFGKALGLLKSIGLDVSWVAENLMEDKSYNWSMIHRALRLFKTVGFGDGLGDLISRKPGFIMENSGELTLSLVAFYIKHGSSMNKIRLAFLQFPDIEVKNFLLNLRNCLQFLNEIGMTHSELSKIVESHPVLLGSYTLKKTNSLLNNLNVGKKRLCEFIQENPEVLKKWVIGSRVERLPSKIDHDGVKSKMMKHKFLLELGYVENSKEMEKALKVFRGKGTELQDRFDYLVRAGVDKKDVTEMVRVSPQILNQKSDVLETKIDFLVNGLGYPPSILATFPSYLNYTVQRVQLRFLMYNWLRDEGKAEPDLALSTVIASSDRCFIKLFVDRHPKGPQVWEDLKKQIYPE